MALNPKNLIGAVAGAGKNAVTEVAGLVGRLRGGEESATVSPEPVAAPPAKPKARKPAAKPRSRTAAKQPAATTTAKKPAAAKRTAAKKPAATTAAKKKPAARSRAKKPAAGN